MPFILNDGTYNHRGVWHLAKDGIDYETIPAGEHTFYSDYFDITFITNTPEYVKAKAKPHCNSSPYFESGGTTNIANKINYRNYEKYRGQTIIQERRVIAPFISEGLPNGPVCSRCEAEWHQQQK